MSEIKPNKALQKQPPLSQPSGNASVKKYKIDLSLNENPFPPSDVALAAYRQVGEALNRYPDRSSPELRSVLAGKYGLDDTRIFCSSGSEEILKYIGQAYISEGDEVIYPKYGFQIYRAVTLKSGGIPVPVEHDDFVISVDNILAAVTEKTRVVFIDNPGNPTGTYIPYSEVLRLRDNLPDHILLVLDEAYAEFVTKEDYKSGLRLVDERDNVIVTRTLSKLYGLSALRIGWSYMTADMIKVMLWLKGGFNVNAAAQQVGAAAVTDEKYADMVRDHTENEITWLSEQLVALGLTVTPSVCNFILAHFPAGAAAREAAVAYLQDHGINVSTLGFFNLDSSIRVSVGTEAENREFVETLKRHIGAS